MSWLSQAISGDFSGLSNAISSATPKSVFSDIGQDTMKVLSNPWADVGIAAGLALPFLAPELLGAAFLPTAGEAAAGFAAGEAAPVSLGSIFGGIGGAGAAATDAFATEAGALPYAAAPTTNIPGFPAVSEMSLGQTALGDVGVGTAPASVITPEVGAVPSGTPAWLSGPDVGQVYGSEALAFGDPTVAGGGGTPLTTSVSAAGGGAPIDALPSIGPGGPVPLAPTTIGGPAPAAASPGVLSTIGSTLRDVAPIAGLGGLGYNLYQGYQQKKALESLANTEKGLAADAAATAAADRAYADPIMKKGETLMNYLATNKLPQEFEASIEQQMRAAKARMVQGYAARGMSTDPNQNSALAQDLASLDQQGLDMRSKLETALSTAGQQMVTSANQLLNSGLTATQLAAQLPIMMQKLESDLNSQTATALSAFAAAIGGAGGGGKSVTLKL